MQFNFILTKSQRDLYIANWKRLHADKTQFNAASYLLYTFLSPALQDIEPKLMQAFAPRKYGSHKFQGLIEHLRQLNRLAHTRSMARLHSFYVGLGDIELTNEQFDQLATLAMGHADRIMRDFAY